MTSVLLGRLTPAIRSWVAERAGARWPRSDSPWTGLTKGADSVAFKAWCAVGERSAEHLRRGRRLAVQGPLDHAERAHRERWLELFTVVGDRIDFLDLIELAPIVRRVDTGSLELAPPTACPA
jgi:hypothetical protein